jgi:tRNA (guanine37-N1)-methyltransferase
VRINIWTIFPEIFEDTLATSILGRAAQDGLVEYRVVDIRDYAVDRHRTVDDEPFGGGAGMVMKPEPFFDARDALKPEGPVALLTPRGAVFNHATAVRFSLAEELTLLCGRYKGVDERVAEEVATEELSVGDYVLSGGVVLRGSPRAAGVHETGRVPGPASPRRPSIGRSSPDRGVAQGAGRTDDALAASRAMAGVPASGARG